MLTLEESETYLFSELLLFFSRYSEKSSSSAVIFMGEPFVYYIYKKYIHTKIAK